MQIVIDIPKEYYDETLTQGIDGSHLAPIYRALVNGVPLPKVHGCLKDELDLDLFAPSLGTGKYVDDLMAKHNIDYVNGDDEDKVRAFALDLILSCMNVIKTAPIIIESDIGKEDEECLD